MKVDSLTFYFGAANGSAQKALRVLGEPDVIISYQTHMNRPWDGIQSLFIDSGGYSLMLAEGEHDTTETYLDYVERVDADIFAVQDYPCEPEIMERYGRSVKTHQALTTEAACENIVRAEERGIDANPMSVVQGWEPHEYAEHVDMLRDEGVLTEYLGIGSVCRRGATDDIRRVIETVDDATPPGTQLHAFGVKQDILQYPQTRRQLYSADSTAYDIYLGRTVLPRWQAVARKYLDYKETLMTLLEDSGPQQSLIQATAVADGGPIDGEDGGGL